jgi:hypothetical protein
MADIGSWHIYDQGHSIGLPGTECGSIVRDDEHDLGARITLERRARAAPWTITCGIYDWMVHTRFFSTEEQAREAFDAMKIELGQILHMAEEAADFEPERRLQIVSAAVSRFIDRFPA